MSLSLEKVVKYQIIVTTQFGQYKGQITTTTEKKLKDLITFINEPESKIFKFKTNNGYVTLREQVFSNTVIELKVFEKS